MPWHGPLPASKQTSLSFSSAAVFESKPLNVRTEKNVADPSHLAQNKPFYPALDGLRALAVLAVFYHHYLTSRPALEWGWTGVELFFVLSGFLITGILYDTRDAAHRFRNFYMRRMLRIFPLYYGVLLVIVLLKPVFHWVWHPAFLMWPLYLGDYIRYFWLSDYLKNQIWVLGVTNSLTLRQPIELNLGHFWSLCQEEQFYLIWPPVVFALRDRLKLRNLCAALFLLTMLARIACLYLCPSQYLSAYLLYFFFPLRADGLLLGAMLALMLRGPEAQRIIRFARPMLISVTAGLLLFEAIYPLIYHQFYRPLASSAMYTFGFSLVDCFAASLILISLSPGTWLYRLLTVKPLRRLGQISYGFYVFHDIPHTEYGYLIQHTLHPRAHSRPLIAAVAFVVTLTLSFLSFRFCESAFLRLKDRFTVTSG